MKKLIYILPATLLIACGGGEEKKEVSQEDICKCSKLYDQKREFEDKLVAAGATPDLVAEQSKNEFGEEMAACEKIHEEAGDENFYEMSKKCE